MLLCVWLFGWMERVRSSRALEKACQRDIALLWLTGNLHPVIGSTSLQRERAHHPMPYRYDVFLSYNRDPVYGEWLEQHFMPLFRTYVRNDILDLCNRAADEIYFDKKEISPGALWPGALRDAIRDSRCMIAFCTPCYFKSDWCRVEWGSFLDRLVQQHAEVLIPVAIHGGMSFPPAAKQIQQADFADFVIVGDGFKATPQYVAFQKELKKFARTVAERVRDSPAYQSWPVPGGPFAEVVPAAAQEIPLAAFG